MSTCKAPRCTDARDWTEQTRPRGRIFVFRSLREFRERLHHPLVGVALERHHQVRKIFDRLPAPFDEFGIVPAAWAFDVDLAVLAGEAERVPLLGLAAIL